MRERSLLCSEAQHFTSAAESVFLPTVSATTCWNLLRAEGMLWLRQMLVMASPTSRRLAWALAQASQGAGDGSAARVGMLPEASLAACPGHRELHWAAPRGALGSERAGKQGWKLSSVFPASEAGCSVGMFLLQAFFWWGEHRTKHGAQIKPRWLQTVCERQTQRGEGRGQRSQEAVRAASPSLGRKDASRACWRTEPSAWGSLLCSVTAKANG